MKNVNNKIAHKVISLFIKSIILFLSCWFIYRKINFASIHFNFEEVKANLNSVYFVLLCLLMPVNWLLETVKWRMLVRPLERISFYNAVQSIFVGITVSIFSPNRIGEFAGRIFFLEHADKIKASVASLIGSLIQLLITIFSGIISLVIIRFMYERYFEQVIFFSSSFNNVVIVSIIVLCFVFLLFLFTKSKLKSLMEKYFNFTKNYKTAEWFYFIVLSGLRYFVFTFQFYLALRLMNIEADMLLLFSLIAVTFFVSSALPTFALTEIAVRGATSVYFIGLVSYDYSSIIISSLLIWVVNLAVPALIGGLFIWNLKFFKT